MRTKVKMSAWMTYRPKQNVSGLSHRPRKRGFSA